MEVKIIMLGILALIGFLAGKTGYLPEIAGVMLSRVVIKITAPILIWITLAGNKFTSEEIRNGIWVYVFGFVFIMISYLIGTGVCSRLNLEKSTKSVYKMNFMFGNVVFLAFPLIGSVFGETHVKLALAYAVFFNLANDTILWTLGIYLVNSHNGGRWKDNLKHLINGNTIAFSLGIICIIFNLQNAVEHNTMVKAVYDVVYGTLKPLGDTTFPLSMLFIGLILAETKIQNTNDLLKRYPSIILTIFKLLIIPIIAFFALKLTGNILPPMVKGIIVIQLAMPCGTIVPALASQYESDYKFATENVFFSTLFCIITLPFISGLVR
ncbi:MAG: AEC family transporter [Bacillota bacterium]|nr:AEC family transporter [Bacillota bacterium]